MPALEAPLYLLLAAAGPLVLLLSSRRDVVRVARPTLQFFETTGIAPPRRFQRPPLWAWCAFVSILCLSVAAARPVFYKNPALVIVLDRSIAMNRVDATGARRFDRARKAALELLQTVHAQTDILLVTIPGGRVRDHVKNIAERIAALDTAGVFVDLERERAGLPRDGAVHLFTSAPVEVPGAAIHVLGAIAPNTGLVGATANPPSVFVASGCPSATTTDLQQEAGGPISVTLAPGEVKRVPVSGPGVVLLQPRGADALPADNAITVGVPGFHIQTHGEVPEALARALKAMSLSGVQPSARSKTIHVAPEGAAIEGKPRIVYIVDRVANPTAPGEPGPGPSVMNCPPLPRIARMGRAQDGDVVVYNRRFQTPAVTVHKDTASFALDADDPAWVESPALPVIVSQVVERLLVPETPTRDLRACLDPGAASDATFGTPGSSADGGRFAELFDMELTIAAAALAFLAAGFLPRRRHPNR